MGSRTGKLPGLVVFDLDGTLVDSEPISLGAWLRAGREFGLQLTEDEVMQFLGRNNRSIQELALRLYGEDLPFEAIFLRKKEIAKIEYDKGILLKKGAREILETLADLGIPACIATSSSRSRSLKLLAGQGILERFAFLISGEEVTHSKPHPEIFLKCFEQAGVSPGEAMVVEDSKNGIIAARRSGALTVLIPDILPADAEMQAGADLLLSDLTEFIGYLKGLAQ